MRTKEVPVPAGFNPAPLDFELARGVVLTVKVMDANTGQPVPGYVEYFTFPDNPIFKEFKGYAAADRQERPAKDAKFRLVVPAGPGLIAFRAEAKSYPVAVGADRFKDRMRGGLINTVPSLCHPINFSVLTPVEPKADAQTAEVTIALRAGKTVRGTVLDPDDKPLAGAIARGLKSSPAVFGPWEPEPLKGAEFEAVSLDPAKPRMVVFVHKEKKLAGAVRVRGDEKGPVEVKLGPWATITGRLVDADGKPLADIRLGFVQNIDEADPTGVGDLPGREVRTGKGGRFTLAGFAPGLRYNLTAMNSARILARIGKDGLQFTAGEEKDVGDVVAKVGE
jgi:hypothetical protein